MSSLKRSITSIFNFKFEREDIEFSYSGIFNDSKYNINLRHYGSISLNDINKVENEESNWGIFQEFGKNKFPFLTNPQRSIYRKGITAFYFLVVDVREDQIHELLEDTPSSTALFYVNQNILQALHLHCINGISYERTYSFRIPCQKLEHFQSDYNITNLRDWALELDKTSIFPEKKFEECKKTFSMLLIKRTLPKSTYKHLLFMALRYHQATFNMPEYSHKFLILMIIFESLFKREVDRNAGQAAVGISKLKIVILLHIGYYNIYHTYT